MNTAIASFNTTVETNDRNVSLTKISQQKMTEMSQGIMSQRA